MPDILPPATVVVVNYNTADQLPGCLAAVQALDYPGAVEIIVVDNASADGSAAVVRAQFPQVRLIASPTNLPPLDTARERQRVERALGELCDAVEFTWLAGQTWRALWRAMQAGPWHVFHFVGHGGEMSIPSQSWLERRRLDAPGPLPAAHTRTLVQPLAIAYRDSAQRC